MKWRLEACRIQAGLTQEAVARAVGVKADTVENWENGEQSPSMEMGLALSKLYQIPIESMDFSRENNKKNS